MIKIYYQPEKDDTLKKYFYVKGYMNPTELHLAALLAILEYGKATGVVGVVSSPFQNKKPECFIICDTLNEAKIAMNLARDARLITEYPEEIMLPELLTEEVRKAGYCEVYAGDMGINLMYYYTMPESEPAVQYRTMIVEQYVCNDKTPHYLDNEGKEENAKDRVQC